jgi:hypothetical protein
MSWYVISIRDKKFCISQPLKSEKIAIKVQSKLDEESALYYHSSKEVNKVICQALDDYSEAIGRNLEFVPCHTM